MVEHFPKILASEEKATIRISNFVVRGMHLELKKKKMSKDFKGAVFCSQSLQHCQKNSNKKHAIFSKVIVCTNCFMPRNAGEQNGVLML